MTDIKFTPGPWRISDNELGYLNYDVLAEWDVWHNVGIATVVDGRFSDFHMGSVALDRDTCYANARLIAAAPDLLDACEKAEHVMLYVYDEAQSIGEYADTIKALRTAIAKAKGGSAPGGAMPSPPPGAVDGMR